MADAANPERTTEDLLNGLKKILQRSVEHFERTCANGMPNAEELEAIGSISRTLIAIGKNTSPEAPTKNPSEMTEAEIDAALKKQK